MGVPKKKLTSRSRSRSPVVQSPKPTGGGPIAAVASLCKLGGSAGRHVSQCTSAALSQAGRSCCTMAGHMTETIGAAGRRARSTAKNVSKDVDPAALGGAVAGLTAGGLVGASIGGTIGAAVAGPVGALVGAELGALTGTSVGVKLGYDVTYEIGHPKSAPKNLTIGDRVEGISQTFVRRAGDSLGSGAGAASGAAVGMVVGGPVGAAVGAFVGESFVGDLVEDRAVRLCGQQRKNTSPGKPRPNEEKKAGVGKWIQNVTRDTSIETGAAAFAGVVGGVLAGPMGRTIGERAGLVAAKRVNWDHATEDQSSPAKPAKRSKPAKPAKRSKPAKPAKKKA